MKGSQDGKEWGKYMVIEVSLIISIIAVVVSIIMAVFNITKTSKKDNKQDAATLTTVIVKLDLLSNTLTELKAQLQDNRREIQELTERVIKAEQHIKVLNNVTFRKKEEKE